MPTSVPSMAVGKKLSVVPPSEGPRSSTSAIESRRKGNATKTTTEKSNNVHTKTKDVVCSTTINKSPAVTSSSGPQSVAGPNGTTVDERLRLVRERREHQEKMLASRGLGWMERERRAKRYHEQQLQDRQKRLLEQRVREEGRRTAVEEKRKQRLREEKERYESAVRRSLEKSQRVQHNLAQNSRGRSGKNSAPRRLPLSTWEKNLVRRLLTPTCSYLARSKSAGSPSGKEVSCHSMNTTPTPNTNTITHKPQQYSGPTLQRTSASRSPSNSVPRSISRPQVKAEKRRDSEKKHSNTRSNSRTPIVNTRAKPAPNTQARTASPSPSPQRSPRRSIRRHSLPPELPPVPEEELPVCGSALSPGNSRPIKTTEERQHRNMEDECRQETPHPDSDFSKTKATPRTEMDRSAPQPPEAPTKPVAAGTANAEEASRLLAERRKEARLQREREALQQERAELEQLQREREELQREREALERLQREREELQRLQREREALQRQEADRRRREELELRRAEERARLQAEDRRLVAEKRRREEEEQRKADEERAQAMREVALLQKLREEKQAKEMEKATQMTREREILAQKEDAERQARKKRLQDIMRRTRRTHPSAETTSVPAGIAPSDSQPKENAVLVKSGDAEESVKLPAGGKPSQLGRNGIEDMVPVVAFKERRAVRTLTGLEEIQNHQRAEVI